MASLEFSPIQSTIINTSLVMDTSDSAQVKACRNFLIHNPNFQAFFWIQRNKDCSVEYVYNLEAVLGYKILTTKQLFAITHKSHRQLSLQINQAINDYCNGGALGKSVLKFNFIIYLPLKSADNKYWYIRKTNTPCELNTENQVVKFLSWHDLIRPYDGEPITFKVFTHQGNRAFELEELLKQKSGYYQSLPFTEGELKVLKTYVFMEAPNAKEVAKKLGLKTKTIYVHNRNMLEKANKFYQKNFININQLADFFRICEVFPLTTHIR